jgi:integrase/recombinase XerD
VKKKPSTPLSREAEAFIEMLSAERGASLNTRAAYGADLKGLEAFLARRKQKPVNADSDALRAYLKSLDYVGMTPRTVARRLSVMRQFFRFLLAERLRDDDPASSLDSPKLGRSLPKVLSRVEVDRLIEAAQTKGREDGGRMETLLEILYGSGLRVSELVALPVLAAERDPTMLIVRGKGGKERQIPLSDPARVAIAKWLHIRAAALEDGETSRYLFPSRGPGISRGNVLPNS